MKKEKEVQALRTMADVDKEYVSVCTVIGDLEAKVKHSNELLPRYYQRSEALIQEGEKLREIADKNAAIQAKIAQKAEKSQAEVIDG